MDYLISFVLKHSLLFVFLLGIVLCFVWAYTFREKLKLNGWQLLLFIVYTFIIGGLSAFLFARFEQLVAPSHSPSNLRIYGPIYVMWAAYILPCKLVHSEPRAFVDICTPGLIISLISIRINCFYAGCCQGLMIPGANFRYPIRELELVFQVIILVVFARRVLKSKSYNGTLYPLYMIWYGLIRFIYEFFREPENLFFGRIHAPHVWSLISIVAGIIAYVLLKQSDPEKNKAKKHNAIK